MSSDETIIEKEVNSTSMKKVTIDRHLFDKIFIYTVFYL